MEDAAATIRRLAGLATPMALRVAVTLGLPDRLLGDGATVEEVAAELGQSSMALGLLLRHLATVGVVESTASGYRTTELGEALRSDAANALSIILHLDSASWRSDLAIVDLAHSVRTGQAAYPRRHGQDFWADLAEHPHLRESFDRQMTRRLRAQVPALVAGFDWDRFSTVVDVGGGHGSLLAAILEAHPGMRGHLVDLDPTATEAVRAFEARGLGDRTQVTAGSFFDPLPTGAETGPRAHLLCDILHDWDDEHARRILGRCAEAAAPDGRILVIEAVGGRRATTDMDLAMLTVFGGRERRVDEFRALGAEHGLVVDTVTELSEQRCVLEFRFGP